MWRMGHIVFFFNPSSIGPNRMPTNRLNRNSKQWKGPTLNGQEKEKLSGKWWRLKKETRIWNEMENMSNSTIARTYAHILRGEDCSACFPSIIPVFKIHILLVSWILLLQLTHLSSWLWVVSSLLVLPFSIRHCYISHLQLSWANIAISYPVSLVSLLANTSEERSVFILSNPLW